MFAFIIVSHSNKLASGLKDILEQININKSRIIAIGGVDGDRLGTDPLIIKKSIEKLKDADYIFIIGDIGSSILGSQMAIDMLDEDLKNKVIMLDAPIVEGAVAALVTSSVTNDIKEIINSANETKIVNKF